MPTGVISLKMEEWKARLARRQQAAQAPYMQPVGCLSRRKWSRTPQPSPWQMASKATLATSSSRMKRLRELARVPRNSKSSTHKGNLGQTAQPGSGAVEIAELNQPKNFAGRS